MANPGQNYLVNTEGAPRCLQQGAIVSNSGTIANHSNAAAAAEGQPNVKIILTRVLSLYSELAQDDHEHAARRGNYGMTRLRVSTSWPAAPLADRKSVV